MGLNMTRFLTAFTGCVSGLALMTSGAMAQSYFQTPAFNEEFVTFSSEGDLWLALNRDGNLVASRLTTHDEVEDAPKLSPNGKWIAFNASYDGPGEVYLMPVTGGKPKRLTFEGGGASVRGWLDDNTVLYLSNKRPGTIPRVLKTTNTITYDVQDIPLADADQTTLSANGKTLFFTRYGLNMFSDNAVMYRGGRMAQLWKYELGSKTEATRLAADFGAPIRHPMYWNDRIYFVTDKSGSDNIWSMDINGDDIQQHSQSQDWQMRTPYLNDGKIIYQSGADLYEYDITANSTEKLNISIVSDGDWQRDRWISDPLKYLSDARSAPDGKSVTVTARGRFVTAFTGDRRRVEYIIPDHARARSAAIGADGDWLYAIIDNGRSSEIWRYAADGSDKGSAILSSLDTYVWAIWPTPHEEKLLFSDKKGRLYLLDPETKTAKLIDQTTSSSDFAHSRFSWSSDGRYLAWQGYDARDIAQVSVYDTKTSSKHVVTTGKFESYAPTFSEDGKWLYFISDRNFSPNPGSPWGDRNMGPAFDERGRIFALQLDPEAVFPFTAPDELTLAKQKAEAEKKKAEANAKDKKKKDEDKPDEEEKAIEISFDGLNNRLFEVPVPPGNYSGLAATSSHLFVLTGSRDERELKRLEIKDTDTKLETYAAKANAFSLSADRKTLFVQIGDDAAAKFVLVDPSKPYPSDVKEQTIRLSDWKLEINPKDEWQQMVADAWRLHRDFAFDSNLRSVDWEAVGDHFVPLAKRLGNRSEMDDLLAQMSAELGILHSQIRRGDEPSDEESASPGFLGAQLTPVRGGLRIDNIYQGEKDRPETLGPLQAPGKDFAEGDVITAINGQRVNTRAQLYNALEMQAGQQILVDYHRNNVKKQAIIKAASSRDEYFLGYTDWVATNREKVAEASNGEIGYLHLRAMGAGDVASFARDFYEHFDKDGLIIDVRGNRGGNIDSWIIGTLLRKSWAFWTGLETGQNYTNMQQTFRGHLVILIDEGTYSDGETFSAGVKALDIAPLIGTRTAGAGIWLSDRNRLVDGGQARVAEYGQYGMDGRWLLEGLGVAPDIEVDTPPHAAYKGEDAQLDRALSVLQEKIRTEPIPELNAQPIPPVGTPGRDVD